MQFGMLRFFLVRLKHVYKEYMPKMLFEGKGKDQGVARERWEGVGCGS